MKFLLKVSLSIIGLGLLCILVVFYITWSSNAATLEKKEKVILEETAFHVMDKIDRFMFHRFSDLKAIVTDPIICSKTSTSQAITKRLCEFRDAYKSYISISFFNTNKIRIADTAGLGIGTKENDFRYLDEVLSGQTYPSSAIDFSITLEVPVIFLAAQVKDQSNQILGVVVTRIAIEKLYEIVGKLSPIPQLQEEIQIDLVNKDGLLLYSNHNPSGIFRDHLTNVKSNPNCVEVFYQEQGYLDFLGNDWKIFLCVPKKIVFTPIIELSKTWLMIIIPTTLVFLLLVFLSSMRLAKPLMTLQQAAHALGKGEVNTRVDIHTHDELEELGKTFNQMAEAVQRAEENWNTIDRHRTEFMSIASHEMRTPLGVIQETLSQLIDGLHGALTLDQKDILTLTMKNINRLSKLINNLLDITKIEAGKIELHKQYLNFVDVVKEVCETFEPLANNKKLEIRTHFQPESIEIFADKDVLVQILTNVLNNAFKFTQKGFVSISVTLNKEKTFVECRISDSGIGMAKEHLPHAFEKFQQFGKHQEGQERGSGLGLPICQGLIQLHEGQIWIESTLGEGTTVTFSVPVDKKEYV